jgi:hypothetical protein
MCVCAPTYRLHSSTEAAWHAHARVHSAPHEREFNDVIGDDGLRGRQHDRRSQAVVAQMLVTLTADRQHNNTSLTALSTHERTTD